MLPAVMWKSTKSFDVSAQQDMKGGRNTTDLPPYYVTFFNNQYMAVLVGVSVLAALLLVPNFPFIFKIKTYIPNCVNVWVAFFFVVLLNDNYFEFESIYHEMYSSYKDTDVCQTWCLFFLEISLRQPKCCYAMSVNDVAYFGLVRWI